MYHNDPHPEPGLVDDGAGEGVGVGALGVFDGDLEEDGAAAVDRLEEGVRGSGLGPPGQRHIDDFLEEYVAAPVTQKPCLCVAREKRETQGEERRGKAKKGKENK